MPPTPSPSSTRPSFLSPTFSPSLFANKVLFCTGGAGSICSAQVRALVYLGADACIVGRNVEKTEAAAREIATVRKGARVLGLGGVDVRDYGALVRAVERCVDVLCKGNGRGVDYVIAGAAGNFLAPMNQLSPNAFKAVIDIDVLGSYNTVKATLPYLVRSAQTHRVDGVNDAPHGTGGRIIFVSATLHYTGTPMQTHVTVAKAGVDALSAAVAIEQGPRGVTSNCIAPGAIAGTEGMARLSKAGASAGADDDDQTTNGNTARGIPAGRLGTPRDIADATVFLFSEAGSYVNGSVLVVDGGAWRMGSVGTAESEWKYPDFLLSEREVTGVRGGKKKRKDEEEEERASKSKL